MEAATLWKWVRRIFRWYIYFTLIVWLTSALMLLYVMHVPGPASASASLGHPAASTGPLSASGPHRIHALMTASTNTLHANLRTALNTTRAATHSLLLHTLPAALHPLTQPLADGLDGALEAAEAAVDDVCLVMRELADEWLVQTVEMMDELRERQNDANAPSTRSLPWQQQQLDVGHDGRTPPPATQQQQQHQQQHRQQPADTAKQPATGPVSASAGNRPGPHSHPKRPTDAAPRPQLGLTAPITALHRSVLPDGSAVYVSPLASDDASFSLEGVGSGGEGVEGEQRVAVSLKDGLVRVTRRGGRGELDELLRQLRDEDNGKGAASAA